LHVERTDNWKKELAPVIADHQAMSGGVKVLGWIGKPIAWCAAVAAAFAAAWGAWHGIK
jgi:hypothetical protein